MTPGQHGADIYTDGLHYIPIGDVTNMLLPHDVIKIVFAFVPYKDITRWMMVDKTIYPLGVRRLRSVHYPRDMQSLKTLHPLAEHVTLHAHYTGNVSNVRIEGNGHRIRGIVRRCCLTHCHIYEAVLIHCILMNCEIADGALAHNVETNGDCYMESVDVHDNVKGFINMGHLRMVDCQITNNITGLESRGRLVMQNCTVEDNSVGMHVCGDMERERVHMQNNTINLLRTQPARPIGRCWTQ